jgi:hypothetical protein
MILPLQNPIFTIFCVFVKISIVINLNSIKPNSVYFILILYLIHSI